MGVIKTALEIALEKTENVKSDKSTISQFDAKRKGKKLANAFLAGEAEITDEIKKTPAADRESLKQGIFDVLITQIALPISGEDENKIEKVGKGLSAVLSGKNSEFSAIIKMLTQLFSQYLQESSHYEQAIRQQYAPKLRKKEEELSRRMGREVRIDPMQDPEFVTFFNQHMSALKGNYEAAIEQAKENIKGIFNKQ
ncbi:MAG: hypothetical protein LBG94_05830 [Treponema sp.]|jgi:hypothetical protein|nr:hypothetical protein [Treponema sp.]